MNSGPFIIDDNDDDDDAIFVDIPFSSGVYRMPMTSIDDVSFSEAQAVFCTTCFAVERAPCRDKRGRHIGETHVDRLERAARFRDFAAREKTEQEDEVYAEAVARYAANYDARSQHCPAIITNTLHRLLARALAQICELSKSKTILSLLSCCPPKKWRVYA